MILRSMLINIILKKNVIFNYKETFVTNQIYSRILSSRIYNNEYTCPIYKNPLINNTIKKMKKIQNLIIQMYLKMNTLLLLMD